MPEIKPSEFCHLHVHSSSGSILDATNRIHDYVARVKELGMTSCALTDHGTMYGIIQFYKECINQGIKPILGCEIYVAPGSRFDKSASKGATKYYHLILLAETQTGYENLIKIVSKGFTEGFYYKPRVDIELLKQYHEGIICTSACLAGEVQHYLLDDEYEKAKESALRYESIFGKNNFFLEIQDHGMPEDKKICPLLVRLSKETGIELVATNDTHYTLAEDAEAHDIMLCMQTGKKLADPDRMKYDGGQYYVKSAKEMADLFPYAPDAIKNTIKIAQRCNVEITFHDYKLPHYDCPGEYDAESYLKKLSLDGFKERYPYADDNLRNRLNYELKTIHDMGFDHYFLIVWDFINFSRENGIAVGPGRGSAAGSVVAYSLGITNIDPIRYGLVFERFLNPERVSMPDIDIDFCVDRRQEVIEHVREQYGKDHVCQIQTIGTMAAKAVIKDVGRVLDYPFSYTNDLCKKIPSDVGMTLTKALEQSEEFRFEYENDEQAKYLIDTALKLEGLPKSTGVHAAGVVICDRPIDDYMPISLSKDGTPTTQYNMVEVEELGLLKMDFLALRNLTVIQNTQKMVKKNRGIDIDIDHINLCDQSIYEMISSGDCSGVFQLESPGMTGFMKELKPTSIDNLIAGVALYRPGPMDFIPNYIKGKENPESVEYDCPQLEPILKSTYGNIVYQGATCSQLKRLSRKMRVR